MNALERGLDHIIRRGHEQATPEHINEVRQKTLIEQAWLEDESRYARNADIARAIWAGDLERVTTSENYLPAARFLQSNSQDHGLHPFLKPEALSALNVLGEVWREIADRQGVDPDAKLAVTSFVRSMVYQRQLNQDPEKLALSPEESSHPTGWAFDIDSSGYYLHQSGEAPISVSLRDPKKQEQLAWALGRRLGEVAIPTVISGASLYDRAALTSLHRALNIMHNASIINRVAEYTGTQNECVHVCVNPEVFKEP
ncbi:hypothetical protein KW794_00875 [Candidatus Saccharibacteria bacterium]|nr:hypothetical protein [Candidatus Saccharibacteria bacterium]